MLEPESGPDAPDEAGSPTAVDEDAVVRIPGFEPPPEEMDRPTRPVLRVDEARRRTLRPWAIAGVGAVVVAVGTVGLVASPVFDADTIVVSGEQHLSEAHVRRIAGIDHDTNVFRLDEGAVERRLDRDPWVLRATVIADLPSTVRIDVVERTPIALATTSAGRSLVSLDGTVLGAAPLASVLPEIRMAEQLPAEDHGGDPSEATAGSLQPVGDDVIQQGAKVVGALSQAVRGEVEAVEVASDGTMTLELA